ncbi:hypothetical protein [Crocosphaera chwakensis]|uniref:Uncharacterized protein n=1 Tax=Crocosphaera chwakensis CCY0110 TaxID=391612 RepID=A3IS98_9CHRO|nr:hypothetical protein [Crocosphaera chwakensis]EAZ90614.1 hypothetical protein CY0110_08066 [Crocosphaera chwakensis CCY0110]
MPYTYNSSFELLQNLLDRSDSVTEFTQFVQVSTEFMTIMSQEEKRKQDEDRRGYLMQEIFQNADKLGCPNELPPLKSKTVPQLEELNQRLLKELSNSNLRLVS